MRWAEYVAEMGKVRNTYRILVGKLDGKPRRRKEGNIEMNKKEICQDVDWIHLTQERVCWRSLVNPVIELSGSINDGEFID
jgi:hypothetical protein